MRPAGLRLGATIPSCGKVGDALGYVDVANARFSAIAARGRSGRPSQLDGRLTAVIPSGCMPAETAVQAFQQGFGVSDTTLLPTQIGRADWRPEQDLLGEMMLYAVKDAVLDPEDVKLSPDKARNRYEAQVEALTWIFTSSHAPFAFEWTCEHTNITPEKIRREIRPNSQLARDIEAHLKDPKNVAAPLTPERFRRPKHTGRKRAVPL